MPVETGLGIQCDGLFQRVQPAVAESAFALNEGLGAEPAQQVAGDDAVLVVTKDLLHTVSGIQTMRAYPGSGAARL